MTILATMVIIMLSAIIICIAIIVYDKIKYDSFYREKAVILHLNNAYVRNILEGNGFNICKGSENYPYLCTFSGNLILGITEEEKIRYENGLKVSDCGIDIKLFIYEVLKMQNSDRKFI